MTVCEFISEPWEWLHEASSRVSNRIYICNRKKKREDKISLNLRADLNPAHFHFQTLAHGNKLY